MDNSAKDANPFVAVAAKKQRALKKKLVSIVKFEGQLAAGKALDEEQMTLVRSKNQVERSLNDITLLKTQLEEVAKELENAAHQHKVDVEEEVVTERHVHTHTVTTTEKVTEEIESSENAAVEEAKVVQYTVQTVTETDVDEVYVASTEQANLLEVVKAEQEKVIFKLLRALHVYHRYKDVTGRNLPDDFDFFGKTLLGLTFLAQYSDALTNSCRVANNFVNDELVELCRGMNYQQMSELVQTLSDEIEEKSSARSATADLTALLRTALSPSASIPLSAVLNMEDEQLPGLQSLPPAVQESLSQSLTFGLVDAVGAVEEITGFTLPADEITEEIIMIVDGSGAGSSDSTGQDKRKNKRNNKIRKDKKEKEVTAEPEVTSEAVAATAPAPAEVEAEKPKKEKFNKKKEVIKSDKVEESKEAAIESDNKKPKKEFKKKNDKAPSPETVEVAPPVEEKKKSFSDLVRSNLPTEEAPAVPDAVNKDFKKRDRKDKKDRKSPPPPEAAVEAKEVTEQADGKKPVDAKKEKKPFKKDKKEFEKEGESDKKEAEPEKEKKPKFERKFDKQENLESAGDQRRNKDQQQSKAPRPTSAPAKEEKAVEQKPVLTPYVEDGFEIPRNHAQSQAKKARKDAETQQLQAKKDFKPRDKKPVTNGSSVPAAK